MGLKPRPKITAEDCLKCGLCCCPLEEQSSFCDVTEKDLEPFSKQWVNSNVETFSLFDRILDGGTPGAIKTKEIEVKEGPLTGFQVTACSQLDGNPLNNVSCRIYENRPRTCKEAVKPNDRSCKQIRRLYRDAVERLENDGTTQ